MFLESIQSGRLIDSPRNLLSLVLFSNDHNLNLSPGTLLMLMQANAAALRATGRIEFGAGTLESLIEAFALSPWIQPGERAETLCALVDLFYHLKNKTEDLVPDADLIKRMLECFENPCRGSVQLLADHLGGGFQCPN